MGVVIGARVGIFGGTFDPVHNGHLAKATEAIDMLGLDRVLFMIAGDPWMKREAGQSISSSHHRLEMVRLAVAGEPSMAVDDREVRRPGPTYTVDTLGELAVEGGDDELFLLLGLDALSSFPRWRSPRRVLELAQVVAIERPSPIPGPDAVPGIGALPGVAALEQVSPGASDKAHVLTGVPADISSSEIRQAVAAGKPVSECVPPAVAEYIARHHLYTK
jgi:nicotinate-nucleotide adenylyltransferase